MKYKAYLPIEASAQFELVTDEELTGDALVEAFLSKATPVSRSLCWQCADQVDTDFEPLVVEDSTMDVDQITVEYGKSRLSTCDGYPTSDLDEQEL